MGTFLPRTPFFRPSKPLTWTWGTFSLTFPPLMYTLKNNLCVCVCVNVMSAKARKGYQIWNWSYRLLYCLIWLVTVELLSSWRAVNTHNYWDIFPASIVPFDIWIYLVFKFFFFFDHQFPTLKHSINGSETVSVTLPSVGRYRGVMRMPPPLSCLCSWVLAGALSFSVGCALGFTGFALCFPSP